MVSQWSASGALKWNKNLLFPSLLLPLIPPLLYLPVITLFPTFTNRHQTLSPTNLLLIAPVCLPSLLLRRPSFPLSPPLISSTLFVYHPTRRPRTTTPPSLLLPSVERAAQVVYRWYPGQPVMRCNMKPPASASCCCSHRPLTFRITEFPLPLSLPLRHWLLISCANSVHNWILREL